MTTFNSPNNTQGCGSHHGKCFSWGAILAGAFVGVGLSFLLNLFSIAIGLSAVATDSTTGATTLAVGGFIGVVIGTIVAMWMAGFTAGFLSQKPHFYNLGIIYGFVTWCAAFVLTVLLAAQIGQYVNAYSTFVAHPSVVVEVKKETTTVSTTANSKKPAVTVDNKEAAMTASAGAFVIFALFFIGAVSSTMGGYYGADCRGRCHERDDM